MKNKETLEEAGEKEYPTIHEQYQYDAFIKGAKWQSKRMYSEEDLKHLEWIYGRLVDVHNENPNYDYILKFKSIIEKFKKK
jgi:hypothetical protein